MEYFIYGPPIIIGLGLLCSVGMFFILKSLGIKDPAEWIADYLRQSEYIHDKRNTIVDAEWEEIPPSSSTRSSRALDITL